MPPGSPAGAAPRIAIVGGGPAGLIAAETLAADGFAVTVLDAMPSVGRKLLLAGRGGLNLTHGEPLAPFLERYGARRERLAPMIAALTTSRPVFRPPSVCRRTLWRMSISRSVW